MCAGPRLGGGCVTAASRAAERREPAAGNQRVIFCRPPCASDAQRLLGVARFSGLHGERASGNAGEDHGDGWVGRPGRAAAECHAWWRRAHAGADDLPKQRRLGKVRELHLDAGL